MLFSKDETLEDRIIKEALGARVSIKLLHEQLARGQKLSLRAVYKAADKLVAAGVLLKVRKQVIVDEEWMRRVGEQLRAAPLALPAPGERISNVFVSMAHLDAFWKTVVLPSEEAAAERETFFYNPHDFWAYLPERKESEDAYYAHFARSKQYGFFTIGGETEADREFKRKYQSEHLQIDLRNISSFGRRDHITLIGSLIITARLSKALAGRVDELYASGRKMGEILPELIQACQKPGKVKFILENNPAKAQKLKRILAKNFYFKQG
jgi:hypothetical protein